MIFEYHHQTNKIIQNGISNIHIDQFMKEISWSFRGTFSANSIPKFEDEYYSLIVNFSKWEEIASHFFVKFTTINKILHVNSFERLEIDRKAKLYLKIYEKQISYTHNQIQHLFSAYCGFFHFAIIICIEFMTPIETLINVSWK